MNKCGSNSARAAGPNERLWKHYTNFHSIGSWSSFSTLDFIARSAYLVPDCIKGTSHRARFAFDVLLYVNLAANSFQVLHHELYKRSCMQR